LAADWPVYQAQGCSLCHGGYLGRVGVFEVMPVSTVMAELILRDVGTAEMARQAATEGALGLRQAAWAKVKLGQTSVEEVLAHTHA
jgi:type IV pilus assembly protein PilB